MNYYKLLDDYLNYEDEGCEVLSWEDRGTYIEVIFSREDIAWNIDRQISIFDLLTFVYGKVSV